jgi:hypothetical protein
MIAALLLLGMLQPNIEIGGSLTPPALVAGPWEGLVAPGEVAGFSIQVMTNENQAVRAVRMDTYVRKDGTTTRTWWSTGAPGTFVMRTGRLQFRQARSNDGPFDVALDLTYDAADSAWKGSFQNPFFTGKVVLRRPLLDTSGAPTGTWRRYSDVTVWPSRRVDDYGCLNIGLGLDDALVLWSESHNIVLGKANDGGPLLGDSYGELLDDAHTDRSGDEWSFVAGTTMGGDRITGALSADRSSFGGYREHYGNGLVDPSQPRPAFTWTRMADFACRP